MIKPDHRADFLAEPERAFEAAGLPDDERGMIRRQDWRALIHRGASFFGSTAVTGVSICTSMQRYAASRWTTS